MLPSVGWMIPARAWRRVLLPAPLGPMTARQSPWATLNETLRRAQKWVGPSRRVVRFLKVSRKVVLRVNLRLYSTPSPWTSMAYGALFASS